MSEERKPTPPSHPRPLRSRGVRPLVPVKSQTPSMPQNNNRIEGPSPRPGRPLRTPVSPLQRVADLPKRSLVPTPPTTAKSPGLLGRRPRPASSSSQAPPKRTACRSLAIAGNNVQKKDEELSANQVQQNSIREVKGNLAKDGRICEKIKLATPKGNSKKVSLFNHAKPPSLEFFKKQGFKVTRDRKSSGALYKSYIPVLVKPAQQRQKASCRPSKINTIQANEEKPDEVKVVDEPTVAGRPTPDFDTAKDNTITKPDERPSHPRNRQPQSLRPTIPNRLEPPRLPETDGENHDASEEPHAVEENPSCRFSSKLHRERHTMKELGGVLPSKFTPARKTIELDKVLQASEEILNPLKSSSKLEMKTFKPLGAIPSSTSPPESKTAKLDKAIQASEDDCNPLEASSSKLQMNKKKPLGAIPPSTSRPETKNTELDKAIQASEEDCNPLDASSSKLQMNKKKPLGAIPPSKSRPETKNTELDKAIQASEEDCNPLEASSSKLQMNKKKPLGAIPPSTSRPETKNTELDKAIQASEEDCNPLEASSSRLQMNKKKPPSETKFTELDKAIQALEKIPTLMDVASSKLQTKNLKPFGDIFPSASTSERKITGPEKDIQVSEEESTLMDIKPLGNILTATSTPETKNKEPEKDVEVSEDDSTLMDVKLLGDTPLSRITRENNTELENPIAEPPKDCSSQNPANQTAISKMIEEMQQLREHLREVKARQCSKAKNHTPIRDNTVDMDQEADPVKYIKTLANDMNIMVKDLDLDMTGVHQAAKEIVENMVERLKKSKDNFNETLLKHEKEILRLQGVNTELKYLIEEGNAKFESLGRAMDLTNVEYEKLEKRNAEVLEENQRLEAECQKMKDDMMFRARELGSEDLLEQNQHLAKENEKLMLDATFRARELVNLHSELQRRDNRSSQLLDEYHALWKDKNTMNLRIASLETELKQMEHVRMGLHEHNSALGCQIAALEDKIREIDNRNSFLSGNSDETTPVESNEVKNSGSEKDPDKDHDDDGTTEPPETIDVSDIGITDHVLFVQDGKVINGLAESSKKMPNAALDAFQKMEKPSYIMTRDGRKIQKYQSAESKYNPEQADKSVSVLKMMSEKIQRLKQNTEEQKCGDGFDDTEFTNTPQEAVEKPLDNIFESSTCSKSVVGMAGENAEETVQDAVENTPGNMVPSSACGKSFAGIAEETVSETTPAGEPVVRGLMNEDIALVESIGQEPFNEGADSNAAVGQKTPKKTSSLEVNSSTSAQENTVSHGEVEINEPAAFQLNTDVNSLGESSAQNDGEKQGNQHAAVPQDFQPSAPQPEWVVQELNNQVQELQSIIDILRGKNAELENEKVQIICEHQGFLLENMQEVKRLKELEQTLNEKEKMLKEKLEKDSPQKSKLQLKEEADWFEECIKATNNLRQIEDLMSKQDKILGDLEKDRDRLVNDNKKLRLEMANMLSEDASLLGLPKPLQGLEDIMKQLRRSKIFSNGVRKKIRCYTKCNVAIQALQRMKPDTIVISIGDAVTNDEQPPPTPPKTPKSPVMSPQEQLLIKKPKLIKKHRMKNMQNQLFQNPVASGSTSNRAGGVRGPMIPGTARPRHKRKNPSMFLRLSRNLDGIKEGREELEEERLNESTDGRMKEFTTKMPAADQNEMPKIQEIHEEDTGNAEMETVDVNETAVEETGNAEMGNAEMETVDVNETAVEETGNAEMGNAEIETVDVNETAVEEMGNAEMETVDVNETAVEETGNTEMGNAEMETVDVNETAVEEMAKAEMETVDVNETAVEETGNTEMGNAEMETVDVNETAVEEMGNTEMETVDVNETAVEETGNTEMGNAEMETVDVNETAVEEMGNAEMGNAGIETAAFNHRAAGELVSAEKNSEKENEEDLSGNVQELCNSVRQLEMLRKSLSKKPSNLKKKKVDRKA